MKHWLRFLPNVGDPLLARAAEIENLRANAKAATLRADMLERTMECSVLGNFTVDEVVDAKCKAFDDLIGWPRRARTPTTTT